MMITKLLLRSIVFSFIISLIFLSCDSVKEKGDYILLKEFLNNKKLKIEDYNSIFVLTNKGCLTCNKSFSYLLTNYTDKDSSLLVISAKGEMVDISSFFNAENTLFDFSQKFRDLKITNKSAYIKISKSKIDTVLEIKAEDLEHSFEYISIDTGLK